MSEVHFCRTPRLEVAYRRAGDPAGKALLCVHGNVSDSRFWDELLAAVPEGYQLVAPDLRGYGATQALPLDGTRGLRDLSEDLWSLVDTLGLGRVVLLGHSLGGGVVQQMTVERPEAVRGLVLEAPAGPFGFGGTRDAKGTPCWPDYAGSGGGLANADFVARLARKDRSEEADTSPRKVLRRVYFAPGFSLTREREDALLEAMLTTHISEDLVPGDSVKSPHWPGVAPGTRGINNALSPRYLDLSPLAEVSPQPPVLWIRGAKDLLVSDTSVSDPGFLGKLGLLPGWPGEEAYPPQPMLAQTRAMLDRYASRGGAVREVVLAQSGHCPHVEQLGEFRAALVEFLAGL